MTTIDKMIKIVHHLISLNQKRALAYSKGREFVNELFLKSFFSECIVTSERNIADLKRLANDFNGGMEVEEEGVFPDLLTRWMEEIKLQTTFPQIKSLLAHFNKLEDDCLKNYNQELNKDGYSFSNDLTALVRDQIRSFLMAKNKIKDLSTIN